MAKLRDKKKKKKKKSGGKEPVVQPVQAAQPVVDEGESLEEDIWDDDVAAQDERILAILGVEDEEDDEEAEVNDGNLETFLTYLKQEMTLPVLVTGTASMGCFAWEEYYTFGPGSKLEYKKLKKKRPSYTDQYELLGFEDEFDEEGLHVNVKRTSDRKRFTLPLADLEAVDRRTKNGRLIWDYASWYVNYR